MNNFTMTYEGMVSCCERIAQSIKNKGVPPSLIVGVERGGLIPAVHLSHLLDIPMDTLLWQTRDGAFKEKDKTSMSAVIAAGGNILVVDDINDTGTTFSEIQECYDRITTAALTERASSKYRCDYVGMPIHQDVDWVIFPWEKKYE